MALCDSLKTPRNKISSTPLLLALLAVEAQAPSPMQARFLVECDAISTNQVVVTVSPLPAIVVTDCETEILAPGQTQVTLKRKDKLEIMFILEDIQMLYRFGSEESTQGLTVLLE